MEPPPEIRRDGDGALQIIREGKPVTVMLRPCFPWSASTRFISLRENENKEIYLINRLEDLDDASRQAVEASLAESTFTLEVTAIKKIKKEFDLRLWPVETKQGPSTISNQARRLAEKLTRWWDGNSRPLGRPLPYR